jgi:hypothetical protein
MSKMRKTLDGPKMYINCVICGKFAIDDVCGDCRSAMTNARIFELELLEQDAFYGKFFPKLGMRSIALMKEFCDKNEDLKHWEFDSAIQRMFLDKEKPKMWQTMMDILIAVNNSAQTKGRIQ